MLAARLNVKTLTLSLEDVPIPDVTQRKAA